MKCHMMNKIKNISQLGFILLLITLVSVGCSVTHTIKTSSTDQLSKQLRGEVSAIKSMKYTFTRPDLTIRIEMKDVPGEDTLNTILAHIKQFSSIDNMNEIAKSVNWNSEISGIYVIVQHEEDIIVKYSASYFKTFDTTNRSEENIDGYKTWVQIEE